MEEKAVANMQDVKISKGFLNPTNLAEGMQIAQLLAKSDIVPATFKGKPENILIAMQLGAEVGLNPMQAVQSIYVVNGRPSLWGDAVLGIVQASGLCEYCEETIDPKNQMATCKVKRKGDPVEVVRTFTLDDARKAGLLGKPGPWAQYPNRMLQMRARSWALRDKFPDLLKGLRVREEEEDIVDTVAVEPDPAPLRKSEMMTAATPPAAETDAGVELITPDERKAMSEQAIDSGWKPDTMKELLRRRFGIESSAQLPKARLPELLDILKNGESPEVA